MYKNHSKIYTKPPNGGYGNKQRSLALLETLLRYWQKGRVKRRENTEPSRVPLPYCYLYTVKQCCTSMQDIFSLLF